MLRLENVLEIGHHADQVDSGVVRRRVAVRCLVRDERSQLSRIQTAAVLGLCGTLNEERGPGHDRGRRGGSAEAGRVEVLPGPFDVEGHDVLGPGEAVDAGSEATAIDAREVDLALIGEGRLGAADNDRARVRAAAGPRQYELAAALLLELVQ